MRLNDSVLDFAPWRLSGTVISAPLNHAPLLDALGDAAHAAPYKAPPTAPVLAVRPRNTLAGEATPVIVPADPGSVQIGATLGVIIGRVVCRANLDEAMAAVAGYVVVNDLSLPLASHYRPAIRQKARDGFCVIGSTAVAAASSIDPDQLRIEVRIDGQLAQTGTTGQRVRGVAALIADITDFMTLNPGDLLLIGSLADSPMVQAGQRSTIRIESIGDLTTAYVSPGANL